MLMWIPKKFAYMSLSEAHILLREIARGKRSEETVPVFQAYDRVLAEDIISDINIPPFPVSHVDGYAVRSEDTLQASINNPVSLKVIGRIYLDEVYRGEVKSGEAAYISTGCALPNGADAVTPVERVRERGGYIEVLRPLHPRENVIPAGADVKKGEKVFCTGHILRAQDIKLLIDLKKWMVKVFRRPIVALFSVGSELTDRFEETDKKKFDSHSAAISILISEAGGVPMSLGVVPDDTNAIISKLREGIEKADVVVTIGGASIGEKDYVLEATKRIGESKVVIRGIKVQPGRVTSLCILNDKPIVMLPGHFQSTLVGFYAILLPLIRLLSGLEPEEPCLTVRARLTRKIVIREFLSFDRVRFVRLMKVLGNYFAEPILGNSSIASVVTNSDGFIIVPCGRDILEEGEEVNVHLIRGLYPFK
ncbi:MAG: molybdopterin molybdotransferase MoeA [Candidatus Bathyarchaeia archaeon]